MTRVDVLLPARDAERTLATALRSLQRQSEPDWRCILVVARDSSDASLDVAERHARRDRRIVVVPHDRPAGIVAALQLGLCACDARFVARMDADDVAHRHRLRDQLALLAARPDLSAVGCHVRSTPRAPRARYDAWLNQITDPESVLRERFVECPLAHPTMTFRTEVLKSFGYRDVGWPEDYDLILRLTAAGHRLGVVPRRRLLWRDDRERSSRTCAAYAPERFTACKAAFLASDFLVDSASYVLWGYGNNGKAIRRALAEHGKHPRTIVELHPRRLGRVIHGAAVVRPETLRNARPLLVAVAGAEHRATIRRQLASRGYRESVDFVCVA